MRYYLDDTGFGFENFPFLTGVTKSACLPSGFRPDLPLKLNVNPETGIISQILYPELEKQLAAAYKLGSMISTPLGESRINLPLANEILALIEEICGAIQAKHFLEPGCGFGFLLHELQKRGAAGVMGCEPGQQAIEGQKRYAIDIKNEFFDPDLVDTDFDCIYHYGVLEHIADAERFLLHTLECLKPQGTTIAIVPDCTVDLELGNINMLAHEHLQYFSEDSLCRLFQKVGFEDIAARKLSFSQGILCVWGRKPNHKPNRIPMARQIHEEQKRLKHYAEVLTQNLDRLQKRATMLSQKKKSLGLYGVPTAYAALLDFEGTLRFFDGDDRKHGYYFTGAKGPIESSAALAKTPVDELWILPIYHDQAIRKHLQTLRPMPAQMEVLSIRAFLRRD